MPWHGLENYIRPPAHSSRLVMLDWTFYSLYYHCAVVEGVSRSGGRLNLRDGEGLSIEET
jgi:hypothetical protein